MANAKDREDLTIGLEVLPRASRRSADHELEPKAAGIPRLLREGRLLVLRIEGADGGERYSVVADQHGGVISEERDRN